MNKQILNIIASILNICSCKLKRNDSLVRIGMTGSKILDLKNILERNYKIQIYQNDILKWQTISDIENTLQYKLR